MINFVVLNGGRGAGPLIPELLDHTSSRVTSIVNAYDDGKSTGEIRKFFGMLGPSDIRKVQELMLQKNDNYDSCLFLFQYRFPDNITYDDAVNQIKSFIQNKDADHTKLRSISSKVDNELKSYLKHFLSGIEIIESMQGNKFNFKDCSIMNCIYAGAFLKFNRNIDMAARAIDKLFNLRGEVIPTSIENKKLVAQRENGEMLFSEAEIVELRSNVRIDRIYLLDELLDSEIFSKLNDEQKKFYLENHHCYVGISSRAKMAIEQADIIIYSAGTQHSSLYPTYLTVGLAKSIADNTKALKFFVTNIGADYETPMYKASDYIKGAFKYLKLSDGRNYSYNDFFNYNFVNKSKNIDDTYVEIDNEELQKIDVKHVIKTYESSSERGKHDGKILLDDIINIYTNQS